MQAENNQMEWGNREGETQFTTPQKKPQNKKNVDIAVPVRCITTHLAIHQCFWNYRLEKYIFFQLGK